MLQKAAELEVTEFLGRDHYQRSGDGVLQGYRNGYEDKHVQTAEGALHLKIPQIRDTIEAFDSVRLRALVRRSDKLAGLIPQLYVKGLSTRDIEAALTDIKEAVRFWIHISGVVVYSCFVSEVTRILDSVAQGDPKAAEELLPLVYNELRKLAAHKMAAELPGQTLQPTALVHEAWLRLVGNEGAQFANRAHFFAAAAEAMRRILVERARRRGALKRGGGTGRITLDEAEIPMVVADDERLLAVDEALEKLAALDPPMAELVKLRYFTGMTFEEAAPVLGIAERTAKEWWAFARAWLAVEIRRSA